MWKIITVSLLGACLLPFMGCREKPQPQQAAPVKAVVSIAPLKGLVEPLLPPGSTVTILMQPGRSEHGYEFTPADVATVADANLVVYVGLGWRGSSSPSFRSRTPRTVMSCPSRNR